MYQTRRFAEFKVSTVLAPAVAVAELSLLSTLHNVPYMQPSELEIRREVEALRDIRRRSSAQGGPGAIPLDPDLPELPPSPSSPHSGQTWMASSADDDESHESDESDDPSHLFWVPARLHPELAPGEFRTFLKEHARDGAASLQRANSVSSSDSASTSGLGRRKSMLSRQYKPSEHDGVEEERIVPIRRKSSVYSNPAPQLTINDLQKIEELAEEASKSDDPSKLRSMLRRSLSLNISPSLVDQVDDMPDIDDADSPIIVPRPNQILRRTARTKIRKPNLQGDGGGHRFPSTRRVGARAHTIASDRDHDEPFSRPQAPTTELQDESDSISQSDEGFILDRRESPTSLESNERSDNEPRERPYSTSPPPQTTVIRPPTSPLEEPPTPTSPPLSLHHPAPQRHLSAPDLPSASIPQRTPSPSSPDPASATEVTPMNSPPLSRTHSIPEVSLHESLPPQTRPSQQSPRKEKEKEKKGGLFGKWGGSNEKKKSSKTEVIREKEAREREKEKDSGFFGSLFGGKKKHDDSTQAPGLLHGGSGPATAAALLGASKSSKSYTRTPSPQLAGSFARYPIHVERAVYRLSHIKLANPRRPLYEQVLISNLMFWYLGVINKAQNGGTGAAGGVSSGVAPQEQGQVQEQQQDRERLEREQKERAEKERAEKERAEKERQERDRAEQIKKESGRKGSLNKAHRPGSEAGGVRRAEMPVRGPQYESQHWAMEQEFGYGMPSNLPSNLGMTGSSSIRIGSESPMVPAPGYHQFNNSRMSPHLAMQGMSASPPGQPSMQQIVPPGQYYYVPGTDAPNHGVPINGPYNLPPGAMMPPLAMEHTWLSSPGTGQPVTPPQPVNMVPGFPYSVSTSPIHGQNPQPNVHVPPHSPPSEYPTGHGQQKRPATSTGVRLQGRSLSATAGPPSRNQAPQDQSHNGRLRKKHSSAQAPRRRLSDGGGYGEEDLPLAVWQQQQRAGSRR